MLKKTYMKICHHIKQKQICDLCQLSELNDEVKTLTFDFRNSRHIFPLSFP